MSKAMRPCNHVPPRKFIQSVCDNRPIRLAVAGRFMGVPQSYFGCEVPERLIDDAIDIIPARPKGGCVYVLGAVGLGVVKVGWSGDVVGRLRLLTSVIPVECILLGKRDSRSSVLESEMHQALLKWRHKGEWFRLTSGVRRILQARLAIDFPDSVAEQIGVSND